MQAAMRRAAGVPQPRHGMLALQGAAAAWDAEPVAAAAVAGVRAAAAVEPPPTVPVVSLQPRKDLRCYDVLGVSRFASPTEIRHAYRQRALALHPDKQGGRMGGFLSLAEAFEILSDASQRGSYDRQLAASKSRDGMSGEEQPQQRAPMNVFPHRDPVILCLALLEIPPEEWPKHIGEVPTGTLREMHAHLTESTRRGGPGVRRARPEGSGRPDEREEAGASKPRHLCRGSNKMKGYWRTQIQMCGIHIRTFSSTQMVTVAESHLALVSLKETFFARWKENGMADFDDVLRAAAAEARSQKMYCPGAMHWFEKVVEPEPGIKWRLTTPCTRDLESTLVNRTEVLALLNRGAPKGELLRAIERMRERERSRKVAFEEARPSLEQRLDGFIACELEHRTESTALTARKRQRLRGKQSMTQLCVQLPWFGRFAAEHGMSQSDLEALLPPLQTRLRGVPSLEQCLQRALRNSLFASGHTAALEDVNVARAAITAGSPSTAAAPNGLKRRAPGDDVGLPAKVRKEDMPAQPLPPPPAPALPAAPPRPQQPPVPQAPVAPAPALPLPAPELPVPVPQPQHRQPLHEPQQRLTRQQRQARLAQEISQQQQQPPAPVGAGPASVDPGLQKLQQQQLRSQRPLRRDKARHGMGHAGDLGGVEGALSLGAAVGRAAQMAAREASPARTHRDVSIPRSQHSRSPRPRRGWRECYSFILQELLADPEVDRLFGQPVDLEMYPDYLARISPGTPVDLRLILRRLNAEDGGYTEVDQCSADVSMVWENAARYNAPGSYVRAVAEQAAKIINDLLLGRRSTGRIWCRAPGQGHRSSLRPDTRSRSETRSRSQLSVQFSRESSLPRTTGVEAPLG